VSAGPAVRLVLFALAAVMAAVAAMGAVPTGPGVYAQPVADAIRINGLSVELIRLHGPGLAALIDHTRRHWQTTKTGPDTLRVGEWQILSRQSGSDSEVLQWRGEGTQQTALYSRLDRQQWVTARPQFAWRLPQACRWQQTLDSTQLQQRAVQGTAQCNGSISTIVRQLRSALETEGWQLSGDGEHYPMVWRQGRLQLQVVLTEAHAAADSRAVALVAVQTTGGLER